MVGGMKALHLTLLAAIVAGLVGGGCGSGGAPGASAAPQASAPENAPASPSGTADPGPGAAFAPAGSLLYVRTPGAGAAWQALARLRAHIPGLRSFDPEDGAQSFARLMLGADFAEGSQQMFRSLTGESSEVVVSEHPVRDQHGSVTADAFIYSQVSDRAGLARWLAPHYAPMGSDGGFVLYRGRGNWAGYSALSKTVWLWASSVTTLRDAIATAAGERPSILADPRFTSALRSVDARGAAIVGYTRGDLSGELRAVWIHDDRPSPTRMLTAWLGLADTAFAIGPTGHGVWIRATPHLPVNGLRPGPAFSPSLFERAPRDAWGYLGVADGGVQLAGFDRLFAKSLAGEHPDPTFVDGYLHALFGLTPADLSAIGNGEQAWFAGPTNRVVFRPRDADRAAGALTAVAHRYPRLGLESGRDGDVVWLDGHRGAYDRGAPNPSVATLVARAGIQGPVSWIAAVNVRGLFSGFSQDDPNQPEKPQQAVAGVVVSFAPGRAGRYRFQGYLDFGS